MPKMSPSLLDSSMSRSGLLTETSSLHMDWTRKGTAHTGETCVAITTASAYLIGIMKPTCSSIMPCKGTKHPTSSTTHLSLADTHSLHWMDVPGWALRDT